MILTVKEVWDIWGAITSFNEDTLNPKFAYALIKNQHKIKPFMQDLNEKRKYSPELAEEVKKHEEVRLAICEKYAKKNDDGQFVTEDNQYVFDDDVKDRFESEIKAFMESDDNKKLKELQEDWQKQQNEYLAEEVYIDLYKIDIVYAPEMKIKTMKLLIDKIITNKEDNPTQVH